MPDRARGRILLVTLLAVLLVSLPSAAGSSGSGPRARGAGIPSPTAVTKQGSPLQDPANGSGHSPQDWAEWLVATLFNMPPSGTRQASPAPVPATVPNNGQVLWFDVKGMAIQLPGAPAPSTINGGNVIHLLDLVPQPDGSVVVDHTSQPFNLPDSGDPQQITRFFPENFCLHKGDYVGLASEGGFDPTFYPQGVPLQIFSQMPNWTIDFYTKHNDIMNGHRFTGTPINNVEPLVQETEGSGGFATPLCPGGTAGVPPEPNALTILDQSQESDGTLDLTFVIGTGDTIVGKAKVVPGVTTSSAARTAPVAITARRRRHRVYAQGSVTASSTGPVVLKLKPTTKGKKALARKSSFTVSVHLAFRSSAKLGSTAKSKDFRLKVKGKGKKH